MSGPVLLVALLATYRIVLLFTHDTITERPVKAMWRWLQVRKHPDAPGDAGATWTTKQEAVLLQRAQDPHVLVKLTECPWCVSFWVGVLVVGSGWLWGDRWWWFVPAGALAASAAAGVLTDLAHPEGRTDPEM
jgi:hypothetical protein